MRFSAVVLAGGRSRRMGQDKSWIVVDGRPLIERQIGLLRSLDPVEVLISGRSDGDYTALGCPVLLDRWPGRGPLAGIERALTCVRADLVLVLAVDLVAMDAVFLRLLLAACGNGCGAVPRLDDEWEPLAAVYPKVCHAMAEDLLATGRAAARSFAGACVAGGHARAVPVEPEYVSRFTNWNSPDDVPA